MDQLGKIDVNTTGERALKLVNLLSLKVTVLSKQRYSSAKLLKFMGQKLKNNLGKVYYNILFITRS